jgi:cobalt-zinc-cadmium resistance protein CzcA
MPVVYKRNRSYFEAGLAANRSLTALKENELIWELTQQYHALLGLVERDELLKQLDSVYSRYAAAATKRMLTGETGSLEKTTADAFLGQLRLQRTQLRSDFAATQERLAALLNSEERWFPAEPAEKVLSFNITDTSKLATNPIIRYRDEQGKIIRAQTEIDKSRLSPELSLGYGNLSLVGWQSPDGVSQKFYGSGDRFSVYQFSMGIPLFNGAARSRIKAGERSAEVNRLEKESMLRTLKGRYMVLQQIYQKHMAAVDYYASQGRVLSEQILLNASKSLSAGEISYMEWTVLMNQSVQIKLSYLDALQAMRDTEAEIHYLTGNQ